MEVQFNDLYNMFVLCRLCIHIYVGLSVYIRPINKSLSMRSHISDIVNARERERESYRADDVGHCDVSCSLNPSALCSANASRGQHLYLYL